MISVKEALEWYQEQAEAAARHSIDINTNALMAIIQALALDAGSRAKAALTAAPASAAEPVKVKPLEWLERDYYYAYVPTFPTGYCVSFEDAKYWLTIDGIRKVGEDTFRGPYPSRDDAAAAAQTDYEQRILSAILTNDT